MVNHYWDALKGEKLLGLNNLPKICWIRLKSLLILRATKIICLLVNGRNICWCFCIWLLALLSVLTGNRHWCLPSLGYSDLPALVMGQVISSWKRQEAIKNPEAVWILAIIWGCRAKSKIILCLYIILGISQVLAVCCQNTTDCLCTLFKCPISLCKETEACGLLWELLKQSWYHFFALFWLCLPFEKCAPWGKLSSWLCSASQEYIALASL